MKTKTIRKTKTTREKLAFIAVAAASILILIGLLAFVLGITASYTKYTEYKELEALYNKAILVQKNEADAISIALVAVSVRKALVEFSKEGKDKNTAKAEYLLSLQNALDAVKKEKIAKGKVVKAKQAYDNALKNHEEYKEELFGF